MATYYARKAGNINAADVWATTPSGVASAVTFASGDVLMANSFAISVNVSTDLGGAGQVRNDTAGGATVGGGFPLSSGVTLTANVFSGGSGSAVSFNGTLGTSAFIVGNCTAYFAGMANSSHAAHNSSTGTLNITGNCYGGSGGATAGCNGAHNSSTGTLNITGNCYGGNYYSGIGGHGAESSSVGTINLTGLAIGGASQANGIRNSSTGLVIINGQTIGGASSPGVFNNSTGTIRLTRAVGNAYGPGNTAGLAAAVGAANSALGVIEIQELEYGTFGMSPTSGTGIRLKKASTNLAVFNYADTAGAKTLIDATANAAMPAATDVRSGVSYASGAATGSCAVPAAGSVAFGVPVDNTTGTAVLTVANVQSALTAQGLTSARAGALDNLDTTVSSRLSPSGTLATVTNLTNAPASVTPSDIWSHASRTITGGTVDTLTNAPSVPSASAIASQVRTELSVELGRVDQNISSRLAAADYTAPSAAPTVVAIRQEMDSNSTKLANLDSTVSSRLASSAYSAAPTTAQIATAVEGSLLNEADGQAVLNAIVGAIGNTNLSEVSLVAAVRADLERNGGKLDSIPTTAAPSASAVASATRTELSTELSRIDQAISSRLASSAYTAPANSDITSIKSKTDNLPASPAATGDIPSANITAIKAKTDLLNTDRLANVATTNIVGTLLAQANS